MISPTDLSQIWSIIQGGGPIMLGLALLAFMLYRNAIGLLVFVYKLDATRTLQYQPSPVDRAAVASFRKDLSELVKSHLKYTKVLIVAAPLLGLLGTVIGMLDTFKGIGAVSGQATTRAVADGVRVALVTTQTGLMIAILGVFLTQWVGRIHRRKDQQLLDIEIETLRRGLAA